MANTVSKNKQLPRWSGILSPAPANVKKILERTAGLWRGRGINASSYQKAIRDSYSTITPAKTKRH